MPAKPSAPRIGLSTVLTAFAVAAVAGVGVFYLSGGYRMFHAAQTVTVVGKGQKAVGANLAEIEFSVSVKGLPTAKEALARLKPVIEDVYKALALQGVATTDIRTDAIRVGRQPLNVQLIDATQKFHVYVRDEAKLPLIVAAAKKAGAVFVTDPVASQPTFAHARLTAKEEAEADAKDRAAFLAEKQGKILGKLVASTSEEKVESIGGSISAPGKKPTRDREVTIHVTATYEIE